MITDARAEQLRYISLLSKLNRDNYSREEKHLIILSRDLSKDFRAISALGIDEARKHQVFYDFLCDFEKLKELMKEFRWSKDLLKENGIDFISLRNLYFAVC